MYNEVGCRILRPTSDWGQIQGHDYLTTGIRKTDHRTRQSAGNDAYRDGCRVITPEFEASIWILRPSLPIRKPLPLYKTVGMLVCTGLILLSPRICLPLTRLKSGRERRGDGKQGDFTRPTGRICFGCLTLENVKPEAFNRLTGVTPDVFLLMTEVLRTD